MQEYTVAPSLKETKKINSVDKSIVIKCSDQESCE